MSILTLIKKEFVHAKDKSSYNNNYYKNTKRNYEIFEECDEQYETYNFYLVRGESRIYLGYADESIDDKVEEIPALEIEFQRIG